MVITDRPYFCGGILSRRDRISFVCINYPPGWSDWGESKDCNQPFNQTKSWKGAEIIRIL